MTELPQLKDASQDDLALAVKAIGPNSRYGGLLACALAGIYIERARHQQRSDRLIALTQHTDVSVPVDSYRPQVGDPVQTVLTGVITEIDHENGIIEFEGSATGGHVPWKYQLHWSTEFTRPGEFADIYDELRAERERAHRKHGETSMESAPVEEMYRAVILSEEIGEVSEVVWAALWALALSAAGGRVATVMNDGRHAGQLDLVELRKELVQVAIMAAAWADRIPRNGTTEVTE